MQTDPTPGIAKIETLPEVVISNAAIAPSSTAFKEITMNLPSLALFSSPERAWHDITRRQEEHPAQYLGHLLLFSLVPAVCLFIGTRLTGWTLADGERVQLDNMAAFQLCALLYLTILLGTVLMGGCIRGIAYTFERRPNLHQCIGFTAYLITPFLLAGLTGLYPSRPLAVVSLGVASLYATLLLYVGFPIYMHTRQSKGFFFASAIWGIGLLVLVTILVSMILFWHLELQPDYLRPDAIGTPRG
jgi:hypothetical protein